MRTGTRCTILVKLPVAFSGGSRLNTEPEAGATLSTVPSNVAVGEGVDGDRDRLAGPQLGELRLLEVGVDIDRVERHQAGSRCAGLHVVARPASARLPTTPSNGARITVKERSRSALSSDVCELPQGARGLGLLRLEHVDVGCAVDRRLGGLHGGTGLVAVGLRLLERLRGVDLPRRQVLLALQLEVGAVGVGLRRVELRLGLIDRRLLRLDLPVDPRDRGLLRGELVARGCTARR